MTHDNLKSEVIKARKIFEHYKSDLHKDYFKGFPRGCCGSSSLLLGNWLLECGFKNIQLIQSKRKNGASHSWLIVGDKIVDITADQFEDLGYGIYPLTSEYHSSFTVMNVDDDLVVSDHLAEPFDKFRKLMKGFV